MSYRTNRDMLGTPLTWITGTLTDSSEAGKKIWTEGDGVLSIQPGGAIEHRPVGTDGAYERATLNGTRLVYDVGTPVVFSIIP